MKSYFYLTLIATLSLTGCKKYTYEESLPVIEVQSVRAVSEDSAEITGNVISEGKSAIDGEGFCYGNDSKPDISENQLFDETGVTLYKRRIKLDIDSTYYFRFFASNGFGYTISAPFKYTMAHPEPKTAPCNLQNNQVEYASETMNTNYIDGPRNSNDPYIVAMGFDNGEDMSLEFKRYPVNGTYTTFADYGDFYDSRDVKLVHVRLNNRPVSSNSKVYVAENSDSTISISFCDLQYQPFSQAYNVKGKVTFKK